jgi:hypothetical protein
MKEKWQLIPWVGRLGAACCESICSAESNVGSSSPLRMNNVALAESDEHVPAILAMFARSF